MNLERLYLDYNATSPLSKSVIHWLQSGDLPFANPASQHTDGKASRKIINEARSFIFKTFNKTDKNTRLFFHSGATEAFHTFAYSFSETARLEGKDLLICFSRIDHPAVTSLEEKYFGPHVKLLEIERNNKLHYEHEKNFDVLKDKKDNNPNLIILYHHLWVHNETGQISSLKDLKKLKEIPDLYIHVDAVQAPGKIENWKDLSVGDVWTFSAHKFGALKGIGFSLFKSEIPFHPLIKGGSQQFNLRSGTENVMGVKSVHLALTDILKIDPGKTLAKRNALVEFIKAELSGVGEVLNSEVMASNTIYFYLNDLTSDIALALFDINGLEISAGSACSSGAAKASAVLTQTGLIKVARNGLRISLSFDPTDEEIKTFKERFLKTIQKIKKS
ncbi:MAG: cysteine desulfurase family protein [Bacteriovoracia bacterium]